MERACDTGEPNCRINGARGPKSTGYGITSLNILIKPQDFKKGKDSMPCGLRGSQVLTMTEGKLAVKNLIQ